MVGRVLGGRYTIQERIGGGGMSIVYRAFDSLLRRPVAVKVLRPEFCGEPDIVRRFRHEAQAAASLQHPNIVTIYDVGEEDDDVHYIVMEYVQGPTLKEELRRAGPYGAARASAVGQEVLAALEEAHAHGIVHRDVKPQNVLLTHSGHAKVSDFGIARAAASATVVHTVGAMGTAHYASPEQVRGSAIDERSDLYSVGCLLYEELTGHVPFPGDDPLQVMWQHAQSEPPDPRADQPEVPPALVAVIRRALAKRPEDRYDSAAAMRSDLARATGDALAGQPASMAAGGPGTAEARRRRMRGGRLRAGRAAAKVPAPVKTPRGRGGKPAAESPTLLAWPEPGGAGNGTVHRTEIPSPTRHGGADGPMRPPPSRVLRRLVLWATGVVLVFALVAGAAYTVNRFIQVPTVRVPNVLGLQHAAASAKLTKYGLQEGEVSTTTSDTVPQGAVIDTDPRPGSEVKKGRAIALTISLGPAAVKNGVPDVRGYDQHTAAAVLKEVGLKTQIEELYSASVDKGSVITTDPSPGSAVRQGDVVTLQVSKGPQPQSFAMPDVVGKTVAEAQTLLKKAGLQVGAYKQAKGAYPYGYVVASDPAAKAQVQSGQTVTLTISSGCVASDVLHLSVPQQATPPVNLLVVVVEQTGSHPVFSKTVQPGAQVTVNACWSGSAALWTAYANGTSFATGHLTAQPGD